MDIRIFQDEDAHEVSALIITTLRICNASDYPPESIEDYIKTLQPQNILDRAKDTHFYVACDGEKIVGCGSIGSYWGKEDESCLFTFFVLPEYQRKGVGRKIIEALEQDDYFLRAKRIEIHASKTGVPFYIKLGYAYKNDICEPDEEGLFRLEKHR